ncbi:hypothetical protein ACKWTF_016574 [Chironomus riparius]
MRMPYIDFMKTSNIPLHLVPVIRLTHDMTATLNAMKKISYKIVHEAFRTQFPVTPCEALTIHKTQGLTIPKVAVNCENVSSCKLDLNVNRRVYKSLRKLFKNLRRNKTETT